MTDDRYKSKERLIWEFKFLRRWRAARLAAKSPRQMAEAMQEMSDRLQEQSELLDLARDTIIVRDLENHILFWNQAAAETYGWSRQEALGRDSHAFLRTRFPQPLENIQATLNLKGRWRGELVHTTRWGRELLVDSRWALRRGRVGAPAVTLEINRDITLRREREAQLLEQQAQLRSLATQLSMAEERERRRIALQLHDGVGQYLAMCRLMLSKLRLSDSQAAPVLTEVIGLLEQATTDTRALSLDLSPPVLYEMGLGPALEWLAESLRHPYDLEVAIDLEDLDSFLEEELRVFVYRAAAELLRNVARHSGCRRAALSLSRQEGELALVVSDQGRGFSAGQLDRLPGQGQGLGLFSIREQLRGLGGSLHIDSRPGGETRVTLRLPLGAHGPDR
ncbi:MAG: ATP-binding protein [Pseudomonadota bacterium]